jgi:chromosome partitioning protein
MSVVFSVANQKGGVGKTTTAVNLSAALRAIRKRVLMVDIDPQGNATMGCGINKHDLKKSTCELLLGECSIEDAIVHSDKVKIDVIPSNTDLIAAEIALIRHSLPNALKLLRASKPKVYNFIFIIIN